MAITGIICDITDFTNDGSYYQFADAVEVSTPLATFILKYERKFIYEILGQVQGDLMIADCQSNNGIPILPNNVVIFDAIYINDTQEGNLLRESEGLKNCLLALIYYEFATSMQFKAAIAGLVNPGVDTAGKLSYKNTFTVAEDKRNECIEWIHCIQWYCLVYSAFVSPPGNYPNFYGQVFTGSAADFI